MELAHCEWALISRHVFAMAREPLVLSIANACTLMAAIVRDATTELAVMASPPATGVSEFTVLLTTVSIFLYHTIALLYHSSTSTTATATHPSAYLRQE